MNRAEIRRLLIGSALAVLTLWLTFRGTDIALITQKMATVHVELVLVGLLLVAAAVAASGRRWELLVYPVGRSRALLRFVSAALVGQMLNILLPIRLGEVARAYWISRTESQSFGRVFATVVVERLLDVVTLGVCVSFLLFNMSLPAWARSSGRAALIISIGTVACAVALVKWGTSVVRAVDGPLHVLPTRWRIRVLLQSHAVVTELRGLGDWRMSARVWILSALIIVLAVGTNFVLFRAFDLSLSPAVALLLFVVLQIGGVSLSTPGNLGVFHYLCVLVLTAFGVERTVAMAYAIVLHALAMGPKIVAGSIIVAATRTPIFQWGRWQRASIEPVEPVRRWTAPRR